MRKLIRALAKTKGYELGIIKVDGLPFDICAEIQNDKEKYVSHFLGYVKDQEEVKNFKSKYLKEYYSGFFKNPWDKEYKHICAFNTMKDIQVYAEEHPKSNTAKILKHEKVKHDKEDTNQNKNLI